VLRRVEIKAPERGKADLKVAKEISIAAAATLGSGGFVLGRQELEIC